MGFLCLPVSILENYSLKIGYFLYLFIPILRYLCVYVCVCVIRHFLGHQCVLRHQIISVLATVHHLHFRGITFLCCITYTRTRGETKIYAK